jgi:AcrR family transcriptional regulator
VPAGSADRIFEAATRLFGERGYPSTSMRDIGDAVGLLAGSLYSHISSKEAVLLQIVETGLDRYLDAVLPIADSDGPADLRMRQAVKAHVELVAAHVEESLVALRQWKFLSGENRARVDAKRHTASGAFAGILAMLNGVPEWYSSKGPATPEEIGEQLADLLLGGLLAPAKPARATARRR